jgi:Fe-S-cluster containining protein
MLSQQIEYFEPTNLCVGCGGCCKALPGTYAPTDFESETQMWSMLTTGVLNIDCWEDDTCEWYVRPATVSHTQKNPEDLHHHPMIDMSWGGQCVFLGENGCEAVEKGFPKPSQCKALRPGLDSSGDRFCYEPIGKEGYAEMWQSVELINKVPEWKV